MGEYYTPRPLIRAMVQVVAPKIEEKIYDGACGSAGFLCESFDFMTGSHRAPQGASRGSGGQVVHRSPLQIMDEIAALDQESAAVLKTIRGLH